MRKTIEDIASFFFLFRYNDIIIRYHEIIIRGNELIIRENELKYLSYFMSSMVFRTDQPFKSKKSIGHRPKLIAMSMVVISRGYSGLRPCWKNSYNS